MLGRTVDDPDGVEGAAGSPDALALLDRTTTLAREKRLAQARGRCLFAKGIIGAPVTGYEIHMGVSEGCALERPAFELDGHNEGAYSEDGQVLGTYLHHLLDEPQSCTALLSWAGLHSETVVDSARLREESLDRIADAVEPLLARLLGLAVPRRD